MAWAVLLRVLLFFICFIIYTFNSCKVTDLCPTAGYCGSASSCVLAKLNMYRHIWERSWQSVREERYSQEIAFSLRFSHAAVAAAAE